MDEIDEALDWRGAPVDCGACAHLAPIAEGRCRLKHACVQDRYARRIDRFFDWNPKLADAYVAHPHFEVRAIAAKHASVFLLPPLLDDLEEAVRWNAARRLPKRLVLKLRTDPHREVRIRVASLLDGAELRPMMRDPDYYVRLVLARRVAPSLLTQMVDDAEAEVRRVVAQRMPKELLLRMAADSDPSVRVEVARRLRPGCCRACDTMPIGAFAMKWLAGSRSKRFGELVSDSDGFVQEMARSRLTGPPVRMGETAR